LKREELNETETICAIATAPGESAIGVIRVSGTEAFNIVQPLFKSNKELKSFQPHTFSYAEVWDPITEQTVDEALILVMKSPHSYTGEDVVKSSRMEIRLFSRESSPF